jgi:hypothetical protein
VENPRRAREKARALLDFRQFGHRFADFPPTGKAPAVGKVAALLRLHWLDAAVAAFEKKALAIRLVDERESVALRSQPGEALDEFGFVHAEEGGDLRNLLRADFHLARPAAASGAALALVVKVVGHERDGRPLPFHVLVLFRVFVRAGEKKKVNKKKKKT